MSAPRRDELPLADHTQLYRAIGLELSQTMGGSSGVLLAIFFAAAGDAASSGMSLTDALKAGLARMQEIGGAQLGDQLRHRAGRRPVVQDDGGPVAVQRPHRGPADAPRSPGDQDDPILRRSTHDCSSCIHVPRVHATACAPVISTAVPHR